jgi:hypothetical protein
LIIDQVADHSLPAHALPVNRRYLRVESGDVSLHRRNPLAKKTAGEGTGGTFMHHVEGLEVITLHPLMS